MGTASIAADLARELGLRLPQVEAAVQLLDDGNTLPFIARYRKEAIGEMKEEQLRQLAERLRYLRNLAARKDEVVRLITEQGKLTPELAAAIARAQVLQEVEDLYLPFRPKRRTRAMIARERGLEPLADIMMDPKTTGDPMQVAAAFVNAGKGVNLPEEALAGARDIVAERTAEDAGLRRTARHLTRAHGRMMSKASGEVNEEARRFELYFDFQEPVHRVAPHRLLALNRGERLGILGVRLELPEADILHKMEQQFVFNPRSPFAEELAQALADGFQRLLAPAVEREVRNELTAAAEERAIQVFGQNLYQLLLQPPVHGVRVMGLDPGFRTGCKVAVVDETGKLLETATVHITAGSPDRVAAGAERLVQLCRAHEVSLIAIGNGTASRETEQVVAQILARCGEGVRYLIVNEAGASVYSASQLAVQEFPQLDVSLRGAVSIARRVLDPLAELVKIEPKHIGVGQYQHDVNQKRLEEQLGIVVESAVNAVGVDLNTASASLLRYVAGVKAAVTRAIVAYREENGPFRTRSQLRRVAGLGDKTFQQCAGFLRIPGADEPLDNTAVHPESYPLAEAILRAVSASRRDLASGRGQAALRDALSQVSAEEVARELDAGVPTVRDILDSLSRPGRDPRDEMPAPILRTDVLDLKDLRPGMELMGTVRNVVDFGAFVDIGVHQDGLVHLSQLAERYVRHPAEVVAVGDVVRVQVLEVDERRGRIGLTMRL